MQRHDFGIPLSQWRFMSSTPYRGPPDKFRLSQRPYLKHDGNSKLTLRGFSDPKSTAVRKADARLHNPILSIGSPFGAGQICQPVLNGRKLFGGVIFLNLLGNLTHKSMDFCKGSGQITFYNIPCLPQLCRIATTN